MDKELHIALAGNPNAGKSTVFNALTGAHQHVGNWPGKTVEKKEGYFRYNGYEIKIVDLPGTYSLSAYSPEEIIARDYIINERPDVVVVVLDAANLERNLYLAVQVLELEAPVVAALNMMDMAHSRGLQIDVAQLSQSLGAPVVETTARRGEVIDRLIETVVLGLILRRTVFQTDETTAFVMELPPYRLPLARSIWRHMWQRTREFLENAWTLILAVSIVIWLLMSAPVGATDGAFAHTPVDDSAFAAAAGMISPVLRPLGFGSWQSAGALLSGFVAKEVVVSTMAQVYGVEEGGTAVEPATFLEDVWFTVASFVQATIDALKMIPSIFGLNLFPQTADQPTDLMAAIKNGFAETSGGHGALAALSFMVFVLIYTPCMVAVSAEKQEFGAKWMWVSVIGQFILAWVMAFLLFQGGKLLGIG